MPSSKDLVHIFNSYFPNLVIEKWFPGGQKLEDGKRDKNAVRLMATNKLWYIFTYTSEKNWSVSCCGYGPIR